MADGRHLEKSINGAQQWFDRSPRNLARWRILTLSTLSTEFRIFNNLKLANGRHYENVKIAISQQWVDRSPWKLAQWRKLTRYIFIKYKWRAAAILKIAITCHIFGTFKSRLKPICLSQHISTRTVQRCRGASDSHATRAL